MARDLARDQRMFNCSQQHEINYVVSLYHGNENKVKQVLEQGCAQGAIKYFTHLQVYQYIQKILGLPIPN